MPEDFAELIFRILGFRDLWRPDYSLAQRRPKSFYVIARGIIVFIIIGSKRT